jgi:hypothetical protein
MKQTLFRLQLEARWNSYALCPLIRYVQLLRQARAQHEIYRIGGDAFVMELCGLQHFACKVGNNEAFDMFVGLAMGTIQMYKDHMDKLIYCV